MRFNTQSPFIQTSSRGVRFGNERQRGKIAGGDDMLLYVENYSFKSLINYETNTCYYINLNNEINI